MSEEVIFRREIKSFTLRSRITPRQREALNQFSQGLALNSQPINLQQVFGRLAPTILEIGFGMGTSLIQLAEKNPEIDFIGIEVHKPGVGALLHNLNEKGINNVRVISADALQVLQNNLPTDTLYGVLLFFPDPWPKRRHHKRRIVQPAFVKLIYEKLIPGGFFHLATDVADYANYMVKILENYSAFTIINRSAQLPVSLPRPKTKFELRAERLGHEIIDLVYWKLPKER